MLDKILCRNVEDCNIKVLSNNIGYLLFKVKLMNEKCINFVSGEYCLTYAYKKLIKEIKKYDIETNDV